MKLLLVHSNQRQTSVLASDLTAHGYQVTIAPNDTTGMGLVNTEHYDLVLFEALGTGAAGLAFCRLLRSQACQIPLLLVAERDSTELRIASLEAGADDFLVMPFNFTELLLRIRALLRRDQRIPLSLTWQTLRFKLSTSEVYVANQLVPLTPEELGITQLFLCNPECVLSRRAIADYVWGRETSPEEHTVVTYINTLRQTLRAISAEADLIEPVEGGGYRLRDVDPESLPVFKPDNLDADATQFDTMISQYCERFKPAFLMQLKTLEQAAAACSHGLSAELQKNAIQDAHRLAGALGIFGYPTGSPLAKEVEALLHQNIRPNSVEAERLVHLVQSLSALLQHPPNQGEFEPAIAPSTSFAND